MRPKEIKRLRLQLGLSQESFGEMLGVHQATVSKWELGDIAISRMAIKALERLKQEAA